MKNEIKDGKECQFHNFITYRFIHEEFDRKVCAKCGIQPVILPDVSKVYKGGADGSETLIEVGEVQDGA